jgi:NAD(P)-dependent dehydrogenase (short-subunit alcohol dehydrogenase family)
LVSSTSLDVYSLHGKQPKHAPAAASEALAHEVAAFGVRVAIIEPGLIQTAILEKSACATRSPDARCPAPGHETGISASAQSRTAMRCCQRATGVRCIAHPFNTLLGSGGTRQGYFRECCQR